MASVKTSRPKRTTDIPRSRRGENEVQRTHRTMARNIDLYGNVYGRRGAPTYGQSSEQRREIVQGARAGTRTARRMSRPSLPSAGGFKGPTLTGAHTSAIFAEYIVAVVIITMGLFVRGGAQGYTQTMSNVLMRLTALTSVFFVLFLLSSSKKGGQVAVWFGLLVDLGVILTAARTQTFSTVSDIVAGKGTGVETATLTAATTATEPPRMQLADE